MARSLIGLLVIIATVAAGVVAFRDGSAAGAPGGCGAAGGCGDHRSGPAAPRQEDAASPPADAISAADWETLTTHEPSSTAGEPGPQHGPPGDQGKGNQVVNVGVDMREGHASASQGKECRVHENVDMGTISIGRLAVNCQDVK